MPDGENLRPLGRRLEHDPRSKAFAFKASRSASLVSVRHASHIGILDQGSLGSCTGNATVGALGCDPYWDTIQTVLGGDPLDEEDAIEIYSEATHIDPFSGEWPPTDTGSSGLAAAKAAQKAGLISGYRHAFTLDDALGALQEGPVITGIPWMSSFDRPDPNGLVAITVDAYERGGHEICADEYDATLGRVWFRNSWSSSWGVAGRFCMTAGTWGQLLDRQGDVTVFVPLTQPTPTPDPSAPPPFSIRQLLTAFIRWLLGLGSTPPHG